MSELTDADVIIVGAGPTGLMLAGELCLAGVRPLVLEREPALRETARAGGFVGQIIEVLRYRGLLDGVDAVSFADLPSAPRLPFGGMHVDFAPLAELPLSGLQLPQARLERLLDEHARGLGAEVRRGYEVTGVGQHDRTASVDVRGPGGPVRLTAGYLVGCDGTRSKVRAGAGIPFPGNTYPEVNRLGRVRMPESVTYLGDGELDVPGLGRIRSSFIPTERGVIGIGATSAEFLSVQTTEEHADGSDDGAPLTLAELRDSIRRVLGMDIPLGEPVRLSRYRFQARQAARYRAGRIAVAGDAAHAFPATGIGISVGMLDAVNLAWKLAAELHGWAPPGLLDSYHDERHLAGSRTMLHAQAQVALRRGTDPAAAALRSLFTELLTDEQPLRRIAALLGGGDIPYPLVPDLALQTETGPTSVTDLIRCARPVLLDLADRGELRAAAHGWADRVDMVTATAPTRPADAMLIRPDAQIAWAAAVDEPADGAAKTLREALARWFGAPRV